MGFGQRPGRLGHDNGEHHRGEAGEGRAGERIDALNVEPGDYGMQHTGRKPGRVDQLGVQDQKADKAADQAGICPGPRDPAPQGPKDQRTSKGRHDAAGPNPDNQYDVGIDPGPGDGRTQDENDYRGHPADV